MNLSKFKIIPFILKRKDKIILSILFFCFCLFPLFDDYTQISTYFLLPTLAIYYLISNQIQVNTVVKSVLFIFLIGVLFYFNVEDFELYIFEMKRLFGVVLMLFVINNLVIKNPSNLFPIYFIYFAKFIILFSFSIYNIDLIEIDFTAQRLKSGRDVGINANAFGYFAFLSLFSLSFVMIQNSKKIFFYLFIMTLFSSIYINLICASRAGLFFTIITSVTTLFIFEKINKKMFFLLIIAFILLMTTANFSLENLLIFERYTDAFAAKDERILIVEYAFKVFSNNIFGVGPGQFQIIMLEDGYLNKQAVTHNSFLLMLVNFGVVPLLSLLFLFFITIRNSLKLIKSERCYYKKKYGLLFFFFVLYFLMYNLFYDMILDMYIMPIMLLIYIHQVLLLKNKFPLFHFKN